MGPFGVQGAGELDSGMILSVLSPQFSSVRSISEGFFGYRIFSIGTSTSRLSLVMVLLVLVFFVGGQ